MRFSPDNRAAVYSVLRNAGRTLLYQPLRRVDPALAFRPTQEVISDFGWSPQANNWRSVQQKSSSDVVLIKDLQEKGKG